MVQASGQQQEQQQQHQHRNRDVVEKKIKISYDWLGYIAGAEEAKRMSRRPGSYQAKRSEDGMEALSAKLSADLRSSIRALVRREQAAREINMNYCLLYERVCFYVLHDTRMMILNRYLESVWQNPQQYE